MRVRRIAHPIIREDIITVLQKSLNPRTVLPLWLTDKLMNIIQTATDEALQLIANAEITFASDQAILEITRRLEQKGT